MCAHALFLSHPGIRCRCLAAYGDAVSAVKWASRLGREHHDDLAQFMLGMGYATEALHLPGISERVEFDLAMQSSDLKRALQCLLIISNSRDTGQDNTGLDISDILNLTSKKESIVDAVEGIVKFAKEFLDLIDVADATAQLPIGDALFIWSIGTQIMLVNPLSTVLFAVVLWLFFVKRISYEEYFLRQFFYSQYEEYAKRVP